MIYNLKGKVFALAIQSMLVGLFFFYIFVSLCLFNHFDYFFHYTKILYVHLLIIYISIIRNYISFKCKKQNYAYTLNIYLFGI